MTIACAAITHSAVVLRLLSKSLLAQTFGADDFLILAAAVSS